MKVLGVCSLLGLAFGSVGHAAAISQPIEKRDNNGTCSLGIARWSGSILWDVTLYNVPQPERQETNIIATLTQASMDKGQSITVRGPETVTITNVDNTPAFDYDIPTLQADFTLDSTGKTKVKLDFVSSGNVTWTTDDCWAGSVVWSAGLESWSCDFACGFSVQTTGG